MTASVISSPANISGLTLAGDEVSDPPDPPQAVTKETEIKRAAWFFKMAFIILYRHDVLEKLSQFILKHNVMTQKSVIRFLFRERGLVRVGSFRWIECVDYPLLTARTQLVMSCTDIHSLNIQDLTPHVSLKR